MKRRDMMLRTVAVLAMPGVAIAQPAKKPARVGWLGWLGDTSPNPSAALEALRAGLAELGWKEGDNLVLEVRGGDREQGGALTAELVRANVDVIVAHGPMVFFARQHSGAIPLVFQINGDAVEAGLVASIARPGGHLTGISALSVELAGKRLEMLKSVQPAIKRVAVIANDRHPGRRVEQQASQEAAARLGIEVKYFPVVAAADFGAAFESIVREDASALLAFPDTLINRHAKAIAEFAIGQSPVVDLRLGRVRARRQPDELRPELSRLLPAHGDLRRQDPEGRQARRPARRAADEVRVRRQPEDGEGARPCRAAVGAAARRRGDSMIARRSVLATMASGLFAAPLAARCARQGVSGRPRVDRGGSGEPRAVASVPPGDQELGYVEGATWKSRRGLWQRRCRAHARLVADLVRSNVDVMVRRGYAKRGGPARSLPRSRSSCAGAGPGRVRASSRASPVPAAT